MVNGGPYRVTALSFGTPHGVVFVDDVDRVDVPSLGSSLGTHVLFPKGASIVFVQVLDNEHLNARLWQLGAGETAYSPEAACVAVAAAIMLQKVLQHEANVSMGGNTFSVKWDRGTDNVTLTGPADLVQVQLKLSNIYSFTGLRTSLKRMSQRGKRYTIDEKLVEPI